jgi:hypothetical protein
MTLGGREKLNEYSTSQIGDGVGWEAQVNSDPKSPFGILVIVDREPESTSDITTFIGFAEVAVFQTNRH